MTFFLDLLHKTPELLALGEPTHGESAFLQLRNEAFAGLAERGFRSIALESDRAAGLIADEFVQGAPGVTLERALAEGFSHDFGAYPGNRDLLVRMREWNAGRPTDERLVFHGFDAPVEMAGAPSPRRHLARVCEVLGRTAEIDELVGAEERWSDQAAIWEAGRSPGRSDGARRLREVADDLRAELHLRAPGDRAAFVHLDSAVALLRYHAAAAAPLPAQERYGHLSAVRDVLMAENLLAIRAAEAHRGPTLVFAHNQHLRRDTTTSAGGVVGAVLGERYAVVAGSLGASPALGIGEPEPTSYEGRLSGPTRYLRASEVEPGEVRTHDYRYSPLDRDTVQHADLVLHVATGVDPGVLTDRILALPGTDHVVADGDRFFHVGADRRRPFATIVESDVPGFDEASELGRPGVFRLNLELGRAEFERLFGFAPKDFEAHRGEFDFARLDTVLPHPGYALYGFCSIVMPGPQLLPEVDRLLAIAHARAVRRA